MWWSELFFLNHSFDKKLIKSSSSTKAVWKLYSQKVIEKSLRSKGQGIREKTMSPNAAIRFISKLHHILECSADTTQRIITHLWVVFMFSSEGK